MVSNEDGSAYIIRHEEMSVFTMNSYQNEICKVEHERPADMRA